MEDSRDPSEDTIADTHLEPSDCEDDLSPTGSGTQDTTLLQTMSAKHRADSTDELSVLYTGNITPETKITARQSSLDHHATIEDDIALTPKQVVPHIEDEYRRPVTVTATSHQYSRIVASDQRRVHNGDVFNNNVFTYNYHAPPESRLRDKGFKFDMETAFGNGQQLSAFESAYESRAVHTSKKRPVLPILLSHQEAYKTYTPVTDVVLRSYLEQIARSFTDLDEFFAGMFVHVVLSSNASKLDKELARIRREITSRQATDSSHSDSQENIYLGDLGHYCEALLKQSRQTEHKLDASTSLPEFRPTHSDEQSWIDYLEDGFEIPYWKLMLNAFATSRLRKSTLGGKVVATALISMRSDIVDLRCTLQKVFDRVSEHEDISAILCVIDKRIEILQGFTDRVALDKRSRNGSFKTEVNNKDTTNDTTEAKPDSNAVNQSSTSDPLLLVTLVLLTLIAAVVPFTLGFKASNETGTASDADFWYNISSSIFTIMANFVMIIQLTQGSRFSKQYMYVWIWFILGIVCAVVSVAIYPFCNTAWSSIMSFFATIAGFGATLSVAMTVAKPRSDEPLAKKKVE